ncbi:hypothetical protein M5X17_27665 [Paenibacillus alvei]|uniref:hypothetical protein n=1 Tax=Paenibacillus alvei TaxID=44250 RepID=UPI00227EE021|nr:hypothetical protein [Paenibacillus alvei]MCY9737484.1 hypothetical protein [Paenibacillus alvei]
MSKNITKHFMQRWVERVIGITDEQNLKSYIVENNDKLTANINLTFDYANFIYKGQIGDSITRNYYIKDDIVFVLDSANDVMITCYKVQFGITSGIDKYVRKQLVADISRMRNEYDEAQEVLEQELVADRENLERIRDDIKAEKEKLKYLEEQEKCLNDYIRSKQNKNKSMFIEIERLIKMIVNSKEYRNDLKQMTR